MTVTDRTDRNGFVLIIGGKAEPHPLDARRGTSPHLTVTPNHGFLQCAECRVSLGKRRQQSRVGGYNSKGHRICLSCWNRKIGGTNG